MRRKNCLTNLMYAIFLTLLVSGATTFGAEGQLRLTYKVKVASIDEQLLNVVTHVENINQPFVDLSLPVWIPGLYKAEEYAKNILRFKISDAKGNRLPRRMIDKQTWRVDTRGIDRIIAEFDYRADSLAINQAKVTKDFAFFTGIQLFLKPEGHSKNASSVKFEVPEGWSIMSALKETADPTTFNASDYDTLVDAPTIIGKFDVNKFDVNGKPHYFVTAPVGAYTAADIQSATAELGKDVAAQGAIFGDLPYDKYVYFYFATQPDWKVERSLGALNSQVNFLPESQLLMSTYVAYTSSHEFFHVWNGERIRPSDSWTIDYSRVSTSPLLWMTEGFTNYLARISRYRAGIDNRARILNGLTEVVLIVKSNEARDYTSPAESSVFTWAEYSNLSRKPFKTSAILQGELLAVSLDIMMRRDTAGAAGIEDVLRSLYSDFYKKGKGFTTEDLIGIINRLTKKDYTDFFNKHVWGVENLPLDAALAQAGYQYEDFTIKIPALGFRLDPSPEGPKVAQVVAGSEGDKGGLVVGDVMLTIDDVSVQSGLGGVRERLTEKIGQIVKIAVKRGGENKILDVKVGAREEVKHAITELPTVTAEQLKVRELWLKKG